jgi:hypothetical protein
MKFWRWYYYDLKNKDSEIYKQASEVDEFNKTQASSALNNSELKYVTHPQAIYTSRLLDFKNLPEPKNAELLGENYSGN